MPDKLTIGSCFSGIGGLELGLEWTGGFQTVWQIEIDPYATKVLEKHWPNVQRFSDITTVTNPPRVDVICGGFPCQDVSFAGKRAGLEGKRTTLWSELFRLVCEVRPQWLLAENVPGLLSSDDGRFFGNILRDLAGVGFDVEWGVLSAAGVGAIHLRKRVFIVAYPNRIGRNDGECAERKQQNNLPEKRQSEKDIKQRGGRECRTSSICSVGDTTGERLEGGFGSINEGLGIRSAKPSWWAVEPNVGRVAHGVSSRVDRLRCLGNAVVPQVAQKVGEMILRYEGAA